MEPDKLTGPAAGALKYDLLTALSVAGLSGSPSFQTSMLRLIALVTARYNWRLDELSVGQRDMARMWSVNERTVKREIKRLTQSGILLCKRQGVRGRVGAYRLNYARIAEMSAETWPLVGPDFDLRMRDRYVDATPKVVALSDYIALVTAPEGARKRGTWEAAMARLAAVDPGVTNAWLSRLAFMGLEHGKLQLGAPSRFVQRYIETHHMPLLLQHAEQELGVIDEVTFVIRNG